jgi:hypothetical protein
MWKFPRLAVILGIIAIGIAAFGVGISHVGAQSSPKPPSGQDDSGLSIPNLGL